MSYNKAIIAAVLAFLAPVVALVVSSAELGWRGVLGSVLMGVVAGLGTYAVPNKPATTDYTGV